MPSAAHRRGELPAGSICSSFRGHPYVTVTSRLLSAPQELYECGRGAANSRQFEDENPACQRLKPRLLCVVFWGGGGEVSGVCTCRHGYKHSSPSTSLPPSVTVSSCFHLLPSLSSHVSQPAFMPHVSPLLMFSHHSLHSGDLSLLYLHFNSLDTRLTCSAAPFSS